MFAANGADYRILFGIALAAPGLAMVPDLAITVVWLARADVAQRGRLRM
ncbi:conserved hypothetical protein [Cupriavidus phytorum]|uniref:Uncharacterized protein n=1 Tax=Cupriavidus taiwanensis TaxID=164546 RepID=A0A975XIA5_9BURK|nr:MULTISPECIES: hypothetical protein [Cupriavidus]SOY71706.1 conserved hypothetical protein [Cupriavidus taiwanensis]